VKYEMDNTLDDIKMNAIIRTGGSLLPEEGQTFSIKGGLGNKTLRQKKKEDGMYYVRDNEECEWEERPDLPWEMFERMKKLFKI
jgi:hypothetical protein